MNLDASANNKKPRSSWRKRKRLYAIIAIGVLIVGILGVRQLIPTGLGGLRQVVPFLFFSEKRGEYKSPDGEITLVVYTNNAGAAHSGSFPTWVVREHWYGDKVVTKGYLARSHGPVPLTWTTPRSASIVFVKGRYDDTPDPKSICLD